MKTKVVVIGSNSFSGSDFIDLLLEEGRFRVTGISRSPEKSPLFLSYKRHKNPGFEFYPLDLNKDMSRILSLLDSFQPDYVVNFAAQSEVAPSWENPGQWFRTNALAVTELAHALKDRKYLRRYLHISTPEVYGTCKNPVNEQAPLNPSTPYAASKAAGDLSIFTFFKHFRFPMVIVRSTNVYGPRQQLYKIIPRTIIYLKTGRKIELHGGGNAVKSYIHIRDVSRGELKIMEEGKQGSIYHLSPEPESVISIRNLVSVICEQMDCSFEKSTRFVEERLGQDEAYVIDSTRARTELGWRTDISLNNGIKNVIEWVNENWETLQHEPLEYIHHP